MEKLFLWDKDVPFYNESYGQEAPSLTPFLLPPSKDENGKEKGRGCVIVCPGGAYQLRAEPEGEPVSKMFNDNGISSFVLNYRVNPYYMDAICADVKRAVRYVRYHAEEFGIDPEKIAVLGFSAGGHLSMIAATHFDYGLQDGDEIDRVSCRPNAAVLCYPLITFDERYMKLSVRKWFFGRLDDLGNLIYDFSGENCVKDDTPPIFMWHTAEDCIVPVEHSLHMAEALSAKKIPFELHVFPNGAHGLDLAEDTPGAKQWSALAVDWLKRMDF